MFEYYIKEPRYDEKNIMKALAKTYYEYKQEQADAGYPDFHGTRDFYSLIKQVTREFNQNSSNYNEIKYNIINDALSRNFGGLNNNNNILSIFAKYMNLGEDFTSVNITIMDLVKANVFVLKLESSCDKFKM